MDRVLRQGDQRAELPDFGGITLLGLGCSGSVRVSTWPPTTAQHVQWICLSSRPPWLISTLFFGAFRSIIALLCDNRLEFTPYAFAIRIAKQAVMGSHPANTSQVDRPHKVNWQAGARTSPTRSVSSAGPAR